MGAGNYGARAISHHQPHRVRDIRCRVHGQDGSCPDQGNLPPRRLRGIGGDVFGQAVSSYLPWIGDGMVSQMNILTFAKYVMFIYHFYFVFVCILFLGCSKHSGRGGQGLRPPQETEGDRG
jgi:hypothetical protein